MSAEDISFVRDAFIQEFGVVLEPLGFVSAKTKLPYFIRAVNDEIIHIIGLRSHGTGLSVVSSATTVYRRELDLNNVKRYDSGWLHKNAEFYKYVKRYDSDHKQEIALGWYGYRQKDADDMLKAMRQSLEDMQRWVLPILDSVRTTNEFIDYLLNMGGYAYPALLEKSEPFPYSDGAIMLHLAVNGCLVYAPVLNFCNLAAYDFKPCAVGYDVCIFLVNISGESNSAFIHFLANNFSYV